MTIKKRKFVKAFTLIEVMTAILIVTIVIAGGSFLFVMGKGQISRQKRFRAATQLATQKLEELKGGDYANIVDSNGVSLELEGFSYTRSVLTEDVNSLYKKVTVTVSWDHADHQYDVNMVTFIAP